LNTTNDLPGHLLRFYKRWISPFLGRRCRFYPSCSVYCAGCVRQHGWIAGGWLGAARLIRCQPLGKAGFDPVPDKFLWLGSRVQEPPADVGPE
jgi:putative membrane protein insertion efficiency factor